MVGISRVPVPVPAAAHPRSARPIAIGGAAVVVAIFYLAKVGLFRGLHYTFDLFSVLQISRGWLRGHPLLYENGYGKHGQIHNYYTILAFGPLVQLLGAYGLFLGHMLLLLSAAIVLIRAAPRGAPAAAADVGSAFAMLLGPVSFWLFDDMTYGWHIEFLYLPLGILFAVARERRSRWALLWGTAIVLDKENGAVVLFALLALESLRPLLAGEPGIPRRLARVTIFCVGLFALGLLFLRWKNYPVPHTWGENRFRSAFANLRFLREAPHRAAALAQLRGIFVLLLPPALFAAALALRSRLAWRQVGLALALWSFAAAPLVIVSGVESLAYASLPAQFIWHGLSWPPRFISLWTAAAAGLFHMARLPACGSRIRDLGLPVAGAAGAVAAMMVALPIVRDYAPLYRLEQAANWRAESASRYAGVDIAAIWCLARRLPEQTEIAVPRWLYAPFHRQEIVFLERPTPGGPKPDLKVEQDPSAPEGFRLVGDAPPGPHDWRACLR
jgi:hypothetical protein